MLRCISFLLSVTLLLFANIIYAQEIPSSCPLPTGFTHSNNNLALQEVLSDAPDSKITLFNIWALWCKPCREELPLLDAFAGSQNDIAVHAVNLGDEPAQIEEIFKELQLTHLTQTRSNTTDLLEKIDAVGLPFTALFVNGKLTASKAGVINETESFAAFAQCILKP